MVYTTVPPDYYDNDVIVIVQQVPIGVNSQPLPIQSESEAGSYFQREMSLSGGRSESVMIRGMVIDMQEARLHILAQVNAFLDGTAEGAFRVPKTERHRFIERVLTRFGYAQQGRVGKSVLLRYLERMTRLSRRQVTRLVRQYRRDGTLSCRHGAHPGTRSPAASPPQTWPCWPTWMRCMTPCQARPPRS